MQSCASPPRAKGFWTTSEHERFLEAIVKYPRGPWSLITDHVGTRSSKQVQTHAQKYQRKLQRHQRGLLKRKTKSSRVEHRVDESILDHLASLLVARRPPISSPMTSPAFEGISAVPHGQHRAGCRVFTLEPLANTSSHTYSFDSEDTWSESSYSSQSSAALSAALLETEPVPFRPSTSNSDCDDTLDFLLACGVLNELIYDII